MLSLRNTINITTQEQPDNSIFVKYQKKIAEYIDKIIFDPCIPMVLLSIIAEYLLPDTRFICAAPSYKELLVYESKTLQVIRTIDMTEFYKDHTLSSGYQMGNTENCYIFNFKNPILPVVIFASPHNSKEVVYMFGIFENDNKLVKLTTFFFPVEKKEARNICLRPSGFITSNKILFLYCDYTGHLQIFYCGNPYYTLLHTIDNGWAYDFKLKLNEGLLYFPQHKPYNRSTYVYDVSSILHSNDPTIEKTQAPKIVGVLPFAKEIQIFQTGKVFIKPENSSYFYDPYNCCESQLYEHDMIELANQSIMLQSKFQFFLSTTKQINESKMQSIKRLILPFKDFRYSTRPLPGNRLLLYCGILDLSNYKLYPISQKLPYVHLSIPFHAPSSDRISFVEQFLS